MRAKVLVVTELVSMMFGGINMKIIKHDLFITIAISLIVISCMILQYYILGPESFVVLI